MKRYDLRHLGSDFLERMGEILREMKDGEVAIFIFEIRDFNFVHASARYIQENGWKLLNSLRFNEVDWTIVVKKESQTPKSVDIAVDSTTEASNECAK